MNLRCFDLFFGGSLYDLSCLFTLPSFPFRFLLKNKAGWIKLLCIGISNINECCFKVLSHLGPEMTKSHRSCANIRVSVALGLFAISFNRSALWKDHLFPYISYYKNKNNEQLEGQHKAAVLYVQGDAVCSLAIETADWGLLKRTLTTIFETYRQWSCLFYVGKEPNSSQCSASTSLEPHSWRWPSDMVY